MIDQKNETAIPLVILDVQDAINRPVWAEKNNPDYIDVIQQLLTTWRAKGWPVLHVKHDEATPTSTYHTHGPYNKIQDCVAPIAGEPVVIKHQNCAFIATDLHEKLQGLDAQSFVLTGVVIHNSMDATIRAGKALGYHIILPADATTAVPVKGPNAQTWSAQTVFDLTLAILGQEYAEVTTAKELLVGP